MLLWTRDVERRLFAVMAQELALSARMRTPLRLLARAFLKQILKQMDAAVLALAVFTHAHAKRLRRLLRGRLRRVRADRVARMLCIWTEWMAIMLTTDAVARLVLRVLQ